MEADNRKPDEDLLACQRLMAALKEIRPDPGVVPDEADQKDIMQSGINAINALNASIAECDRRVNIARHSVEIDRLADEAKKLWDRN